MRSRLKKLLFWSHLIAGVTAGVVIANLCVTGILMSFEEQLIAGAEGSTRASPSGPPLSIDALIARAAELRPKSRVGSVVVDRDPMAAVALSLGNDGWLHLDPATGALREGTAQRLRDFLHGAEDLHRALLLQGDQRDWGLAATGAANAFFFTLILSGLYLWWPRPWTRKNLRRGLVPGRGLKGKARDWSWHNAFGALALPALAVISFSGLATSYKPVTALVFRAMGSPAPERAPEPKRKPAGPALPLEPLLARARSEVPDWERITVRPPRKAGDPSNLNVRERDRSPRFAAVQLSFDASTHQLLKREGYADFNRGRKARTWLRYLHTGQALGPFGQLTALLAASAGLVLVWTGGALSYRRFVGWRRRTREAAPASAPPQTDQQAA
jgi:uncharacterized iron-regulated membrane protein